MIQKCVSKFLLARQHENLVEFLCCNLKINPFYLDQSYLYFLVIFEFARFCKDLTNGSLKVVETFTSGSSFYQQDVVKMLLRLIIWNIFKSIGEENAPNQVKTYYLC